MTARVGEAGGTLTLSDGAQMRVAAGSLGDNTEVEFRIVEDVPLFRYRSELEPLGPVLFASPPTALLDDGFLEVSFPATTLPGELRPDQLALAVEQEIPERVNTLGAPEVRWQYVPAIRDNERVLARINVIPGMRMRFVVYR